MKKNIRKYFVYGLALLVFLNLLGVSFFHHNVANAAPGDGLASTYGVPVADGNANFTADDIRSVTWVDAAHIELIFATSDNLKATFIPTNDADNGSSELRDQRRQSRNGDGNVEYRSQDIGCFARISFDLDESKSVRDFVMTELTVGKVDIDFRTDSASDCKDGNEFDIDIAKPKLSIAYFKWVDSGRIVTADGQGPGTFTRASEAGSNYFIKDSDAGVSNCRDKALVDPAANTVTWWELDTDYFGDPPAAANAGNDCQYLEDGFPLSNVSMPLAGEEAKNLAAGTGAVTAIGGGTLGTTSGDENATCEASGNPFSWIICPIINGSLDGAAVIFRNIIEPALRVNPISTETTEDNPIYTIWISFRTLGNIVLVFALLFIVFGQAIGGGLVDAYTAKKTMPRILVAAILINLSIYICALLVDIFNVMGSGIAQLIIAPVKESGEFSIRPQFGESAAFGTIALLTLIIGAFAAILISTKGVSAGAATNAKTNLSSVLVYLMLFVVVPIILAALAIMITLFIRQGLVMFLIIVSPIAMALFAVPSADKYAKKWLDTFIKTLVVYPIIVAIFALSQVLAVLIYNTGDGGFGSSISKLITVAIVGFAPLFMIPFAFKFAGGLIGSVYGVATGGKQKIQGAMGNDKHNPYSLRNRWFGEKKHNMSHVNSEAMRDVASSMKSKATMSGTRDRVGSWRARRRAAGVPTTTVPVPPTPGGPAPTGGGSGPTGGSPFGPPTGPAFGPGTPGFPGAPGTGGAGPGGPAPTDPDGVPIFNRSQQQNNTRNAQQQAAGNTSPAIRSKKWSDYKNNEAPQGGAATPAQELQERRKWAKHVTSTLKGSGGSTPSGQQLPAPVPFKFNGEDATVVKKEDPTTNTPKYVLSVNRGGTQQQQEFSSRELEALITDTIVKNPDSYEL